MCHWRFVSNIEAVVTLKVILAYFAVHLAIRRLLLVGILLDETCFQVGVEIWEGLVSLSLVKALILPDKYRSTVHHVSQGDRNSRPA